MTAFFFVIAALCLIAACGVVVSRNPVHSAMWLVLNLMGVAALFAMLDAHFLAVVQVIVYAGAIMVLVIFVLMLLNLKVEKPKPLGKVMLGFCCICGLGFLYVVAPLIHSTFSTFPEPQVAIEGSVKNIGALLYSRYVFPFEAASILIMAAIVGAVMLARKTFKD